MHYHIILTERCNLRCSYCYEKSMKEFDNGLEEKWDYDLDAPVDSEVSVESLKKLLKPEDTLIFYGGEPLVMVDRIKEIMDNIPCRFAIQTNGVFLDQLPEKYLMKIDKMLVSIDGEKERDEKGKGKGHYERVISNLKDIRSKGYKGEIVARMVVTESDIYDQVMHVVELINEGLYDSVHWQIDAGFYKFDYDREKFEKFVEEYNSSIDELLDFWFSEMRRPQGGVPPKGEVGGKGKVWKFYPFLGIFNRVMGWDENKGLPCGSGHSNFSITTSGKLSACPIMNSVKNMYCGSVDKGVEKEIEVKGCEDCSYLGICGGRCLYWREAQLWPKEGDEMICSTIKHLIDSIRERKKFVEELLNSGNINKKDFEFEKYFGPEIIP